MFKQSFTRITKILTVLLTVLFVATMTVGAASACGSDHGSDCDHGSDHGSDCDHGSDYGSYGDHHGCDGDHENHGCDGCLLYTSPSPRDRQKSRMPSSA